MLCSTEKSNMFSSRNDRSGAAFLNEAHGLWQSQSSVRVFKSYHSLGKNLSRGFSMTEHVESELLLLLLPGRQRNEPNGNQRKRKQENEHIYRENFSSRERIFKDNQALFSTTKTYFLLKPFVVVYPLVSISQTLLGELKTLFLWASTIGKPLYSPKT